MNQKMLSRTPHWGFLLALIPIPLLILDLSLDTPFLMLVLFFVALPVLRFFWPIEYPEVTDSEALPWLQEKILYWLPFVFAVLWVITLCAIPLFLDFANKDAYAVVFLWLSLWVGFSLTLPASHDLIHRRTWIEVFAGRVLAASVGLFFLVEEHKTHHMLSGQGADSDAALEDEVIYFYAWHTHWAGLQAAWEWEMGSQVRQSRGAWSNRVVWTAAIPLTLLVWFGLWLGLVGVLLYLTLAVGANFAFRGINYVQHWGLRNVPKICGGEGVAWTSTCIFQSWIIFNIAFHQDHHERPTRLYYNLVSDPTSLKLPFSYPIAFLAALVPAIYRKVMSPRLAVWVAAKSSGESLYLDERCILPRPPTTSGQAGSKVRQIRI